MKIVFSIEPANKAEAELIVKEDDIISRQSIIMRTAASLGMEAKLGNVYVLVIDGSDVSINKARELLKNLAKLIEDSDEIFRKIKEDDEKAVEGFGAIFG
jgi:hypothetical protein